MELEQEPLEAAFPIAGHPNVARPPDARSRGLVQSGGGQTERTSVGRQDAASEADTASAARVQSGAAPRVAPDRSAENRTAARSLQSRPPGSVAHGSNRDAIGAAFSDERRAEAAHDRQVIGKIIGSDAVL